MISIRIPSLSADDLDKIIDWCGEFVGSNNYTLDFNYPFLDSKFTSVCFSFNDCKNAELFKLRWY